MVDGMTWTVDLCNNFAKIGEAVAYQFDGSVAELRAGFWTLQGSPIGLPATDVALVDSVLVWENNQIRYAGIVRSVPDADAKYQRVLTASGTQIMWQGVDLFGLLGIRQCWPDPATLPPWADSHDTRTGPASTVAMEYISHNMGALARPERMIANVDIIDGVLGTVGTWTRRLEPLDTTVADICRQGGITCSADMPTVGVIEYTFRSVQDYRDQYIFSDQGDLEQIDRLIVPATGTTIVAAGQGELTARDFAIAESGETGLDRVESVYENTNILDAATLQLAANAQLALQDDVVTVDAIIADQALQRIRFGTDYQLGDILGVEIDGVRYGSPVTAVNFTIGVDRQRVRPILGNAARSALSELLSDVTELSNRFGRSIA